MLYIDPNGHFCVDTSDGTICSEDDDWSIITQPSPREKPTNPDLARQDYLFSLIFPGSGYYGEWSGSDWDYYYANRTKLWKGNLPWIHDTDPRGWNSYAIHVERLAAHYGAGDETQFVRDFALFFGGISAIKSWFDAAWEARGGPLLGFYHEGNQGLKSKYVDTLNPEANQSHHYAGAFFVAYFTGATPGLVTNLVREIQPGEFNPGDIYLGSAATLHAIYLRGSGWQVTPMDVPNLIRQLVSGN